MKYCTSSKSGVPQIFTVNLFRKFLKKRENHKYLIHRLIRLQYISPSSDCLISLRLVRRSRGVLNIFSFVTNFKSKQIPKSKVSKKKCIQKLYLSGSCYQCNIEAVLWSLHWTHWCIRYAIDCGSFFPTTPTRIPVKKSASSNWCCQCWNQNSCTPHSNTFDKSTSHTLWTNNVSYWARQTCRP